MTHVLLKQSGAETKNVLYRTEKKTYQNLIFRLLVCKTKYAQLSAIGSCFSSLFVIKVEMVSLQLTAFYWVLILALEKFYELFTKVLISDNPPAIIV